MGAEEIVARIALNYGLPSINLEWIPITAVPDFYPDHVDGVYDVIFMSLFKTAMRSAPVAPRPDIWNFSCGLLTTEPLRYYVCPSAYTKGLNFESAETLDTPSTIVEFPDRITSAVDGFILDTQPIATYQNTGAAFR